MRVITHRALVEFSREHSDASSPLDAWYRLTLQADWRNWADVHRIFPHADLVGRYTVFNIGGNKYRLIAEINYPKHLVFVRHVLTHADYDKGSWKR